MSNFVTASEISERIQSIGSLDLKADYHYPSDHLPHAVRLTNSQMVLRILTYNPLAQDYLPHISGNPMPQWYIERNKTQDFFENGQQLYQSKLATASYESRLEANFNVINKFIAEAEAAGEPWVLCLQEVDRKFNLILQDRLNYPVCYAHFNRVRKVTGQIMYSPKLKLVSENTLYFNGGEGNFAQVVKFTKDALPLTVVNVHMPFKLADQMKLPDFLSACLATGPMVMAGDTNAMCQHPSQKDPNDVATYWPDLAKYWQNLFGLHLKFTQCELGFTNINPVRNIDDPSSQQRDHFDHIMVLETATSDPGVPPQTFDDYHILPLAATASSW